MIPIFLSIFNHRNSHLQLHYPLFSSHSFADHTSWIIFADFLHVCCIGTSHPENLARLSVLGEQIQAQVVNLKGGGGGLVST